MSNRSTVLIAIGVVAAIAVLIVLGELFRPSHVEKASDISSANEPDPAPLLFPSTPDTALPVISTEPPSTTTTRPRPTTTTTEPPAPEPEAEVSGTTVEVTDATGVSLDDPDMAKWREIALCEMPGPGGVPSEPWGAHWSFKGSKFSGALGIATQSTWRAFGGLEFGPTAGHATWQEQIIVARRIRDRYGYSAWGCG